MSARHLALLVRVGALVCVGIWVAGPSAGDRRPGPNRRQTPDFGITAADLAAAWAAADAYLEAWCAGDLDRMYALVDDYTRRFASQEEFASCFLVRGPTLQGRASRWVSRPLRARVTAARRCAFVLPGQVPCVWVDWEVMVSLRSLLGPDVLGSLLPAPGDEASAYEALRLWVGLPARWPRPSGEYLAQAFALATGRWDDAGLPADAWAQVPADATATHSITAVARPVGGDQVVEPVPILAPRVTLRAKAGVNWRYRLALVREEQGWRVGRAFAPSPPLCVAPSEEFSWGHLGVEPD